MTRLWHQLVALQLIAVEATNEKSRSNGEAPSTHRCLAMIVTLSVFPDARDTTYSSLNMCSIRN